jgi:hypothetical protein
MAAPIQPEVVDSVEVPEKAKPPRRALVRYKIRRLPAEARRELEARMAAEDFASMQELSEWLERKHGQRISAPSLSDYYRNHFDPVLKAVKIATSQAAEIVRVSGGDDDVMSGALLRLVQTAIFDLLVELQRSRHLIARIPAAYEHAAAIAEGKRARDDGSQEEPVSDRKSPEPPSKRVEVAAITALGKVTATVSKAVIDLHRWREEMRDRLNAKVAAATAKISAAAHEGGMSAQTEEKIRTMLMEIKV